MEGTPVYLSAMNTLAGGATGITDAGRLQSPARLPMLIEEVRFLVRGPDDGIFSDTDNLGCLIQAKLQMGQMPISDGFIPLWLYGVSHNDYDPVRGTSGLNGVGQANFYSLYRWKFNKPLYVNPGSCITANYERIINPLSPTTGTVHVEFACLGRVVGPYNVPKLTRPVPYIIGYATAENVGTIIAAEQSFKNPFRNTLHIYRAHGRLMARTAQTDNFDAAGVGVLSGNADVQIKASTFDDYNIIRDFTPFSAIFDINRRAWDLQYDLPAEMWLRVQLQGINQAADSRNMTAMLAVLGHREEPV